MRILHYIIKVKTDNFVHDICDMGIWKYDVTGKRCDKVLKALITTT